MKAIKLILLAILTIIALAIWGLYDLAAKMDFCGLED